MNRNAIMNAKAEMMRVIHSIHLQSRFDREETQPPTMGARVGASQH
jgi:hypothetical protein